MQADGRGSNVLQRVAFQIAEEGDSGWYRFWLNPQSIKHSKPQRSTVIKTKSNIIVEDFGKDIETISFSGTTGFALDKYGNTGEQRLRNLDTFIKNYATQAGDGNTPPNELTFHNFTEGQSFIVHLEKEGIEIERSVDQPLLFTFSITLSILRNADTPSDRETIDPEIGTKSSSISSTQSTTVINPANANSTESATAIAVGAIKTIIGYN